MVEQKNGCQEEQRLEEVLPARLHRSGGSPALRLSVQEGELRRLHLEASGRKPEEGSQRRPPETMYTHCTAKSLLNHSPFVTAVNARCDCDLLRPKGR